MGTYEEESNISYYQLLDNYVIWRLEIVEPTSNCSTPTIQTKFSNLISPNNNRFSHFTKHQDNQSIFVTTNKPIIFKDFPVHKKKNLISNLEAMIEELQQKVIRIKAEVKEQDVSADIYENNSTDLNIDPENQPKQTNTYENETRNNQCPNIASCQHFKDLISTKVMMENLARDKCLLEEKIVKLRLEKNSDQGTDAEKRVKKLETENRLLQEKLKLLFEKLCEINKEKVNDISSKYINQKLFVNNPQNGDRTNEENNGHNMQKLSNTGKSSLYNTLFNIPITNKNSLFNQLEYLGEDLIIIKNDCYNLKKLYNLQISQLNSKHNELVQLFVNKIQQISQEQITQAKLNDFHKQQYLDILSNSENQTINQNSNNLNKANKSISSPSRPITPILNNKPKFEIFMNQNKDKNRSKTPTKPPTALKLKTKLITSRNYNMNDNKIKATDPKIIPIEIDTDSVDSCNQSDYGMPNCLDIVENVIQNSLIESVEVVPESEKINNIEKFESKHGHEEEFNGETNSNAFSKNNCENSNNNNLITSHEKSKEIIHEQGFEIKRMLFDNRSKINVVCLLNHLIPVNESNIAYENMLTNSNIKMTYKGRTKSFDLDYVFDYKRDQDVVFNLIKPKLSQCFDGHCTCIFAYGATGTGKSYSIEGSLEKSGLVELSATFLLNQIANRNINYNLTISIIELKNDIFRDILDKNGNKVDTRQNPDGSISLLNLNTQQVSCSNDIIMALNYTNTLRNSPNSNFTHYIYTLYLNSLSTDGTKSNLIGKVNMVLLAGSERYEKNSIDSARSKDYQNVTKSLTCLGDVLYALISKKSHIPYRCSKLTHFLQDSLLFTSQSDLILHINQNEANLSETISTLMFGQRVRGAQDNPYLTISQSKTGVIHSDDSYKNDRASPSNSSSTISNSNISMARPRRPSISNVNSFDTSTSRRRGSVSSERNNSLQVHISTPKERESRPESRRPSYKSTSNSRPPIFKLKT